MSNLTLKQDAFAYHMAMQDFEGKINITNAAKSAGYSEICAAQEGSKNMKKPKIQEAIKKYKAEKLAQHEIGADRILLELKHIALTDMTQVYDESGNIMDFKDWPEDCKKALTSIENNILVSQSNEEVTVSVRRVKFSDKMKALELLGKHLELFTDKVKWSGNLKVKAAELTDDELANIVQTSGAGITETPESPEQPDSVH